MAAQHRTGPHQATAVRTRRKWSHVENRTVMECFYKSDPDTLGYRKRMYKIWCDKDMFHVTEQRLLDQKNQILKKGWLTDLEIDDIKRNLQQIESPVEVENREAAQDIENETQPRSDMHLDYNRESEIDNIYVDLAELSQDEKKMFQRLKDIRERNEKGRLPSLNGVDRWKLRTITQKVNKVMAKLKVESITDVNDLLYSGAVLVTETLGIKVREQQKEKTKPWWRRRLEWDVNQLQKDLGRVKTLIEKKNIKKKHRDELQRKYRLKQTGLHTVREVIRQRMIAKRGKIQRYDNRIKKFQQNRAFANNQGKFFKVLNNEGMQQSNERPNAEETKAFWSEI